MTSRTSLDDADRTLLQGKNVAVVSTLRRDGTILNVPVWVDVDGEDVVLNSEATRAWPRNLRERGQVTITVMDHENPYEYVSLSGRLVSETTDGAFEHGDRMAQRYLGVDAYPYHQEGDVRVLLRVRPDRVTHVGG